MSPEDKPDDPAADAPSIPRDSEGPLFSEAWEGQAFAVAVALRDRAVLHWPDFVTYLSAEIAAAGQKDDGRDYYRHWLRAMERLLLDKQLLTAEEMSRCCTELAALRRHEHDHDAGQSSAQIPRG